MQAGVKRRRWLDFGTMSLETETRKSEVERKLKAHKEDLATEREDLEGLEKFYERMKQQEAVDEHQVTLLRLDIEFTKRMIRWEEERVRECEGELWRMNEKKE